MKWKNIVDVAKDVKKYVEKNKDLPGKVDGLTLPGYGYLLTQAVLHPGKNIVNKTIKTAPKPSGDSIDLSATKKNYTEIAEDITSFCSKEVRLPNYDVFQNKKINIKLCIYCFSKIVVFYDEEKRLPNTCEFKSSAFKSNTKSTTSKYTTKGKNVCKELVTICKMNINNYKDVYNAMKKFSYEFYNNDVKPRAKTLKDKAGNCTDLNQIAYYALKELGYEVQIVRGVVKCSNGQKYGHVWCRIKLSGKWVHFDASAAAKGIEMGKLICPTMVEITNINPSWAVSDDGIT